MMKAIVVLLVLTAAAQAGDQAPPRVIRIQAERFAFSPSKVTVSPGEEVEIHLTSDDTSHGFKVDGTDIDIEIPKRGRGEAIVRFKATGDGPYTFECSRMCGAGHHFMRGEIAVKQKAVK